MSARSFYTDVKSMTLGDVAELTGAVVEGDRSRAVSGIAALDRAGPGDLVFLDSAKFAAATRSTNAAACLTTAKLADAVPPATARLIVAKPFHAFVAVARMLYPEALRPSLLGEGGTGRIAASAVVHASARLEAGVSIEPGAVIGAAAEIGAGTQIGANAVVGAKVCIGRECSIGANASIAHALIGDRVIIHPGARIGQDGFGFVMGAGGHQKIPQLGRVIIQDDVEIGAGTTIDRGGLRDTVIGEGSKIDNQVQVGHNVSIGRHCVLVAQVGIAGSCVIEDYAVLGGQVGVADNLTIGEGAKVAAKSGVWCDIPAGETWVGSPVMPGRQYWKAWAVIRSQVKARETARQPGAGASAATEAADE